MQEISGAYTSLFLEKGQLKIKEVSFSPVKRCMRPQKKRNCEKLTDNRPTPLICVIRSTKMNTKKFSLDPGEPGNERTAR